MGEYRILPVCPKVTPGCVPLLDMAMGCVFMLLSMQTLKRILSQ